MLGVGLSFIRPSFEKASYKSIVIEVKENYFIAESSLERFYVYEKDNNRELFDILEIKGTKKELDFATYESSFDFNQYLNNKGVYSQIVYPKIEVILSNPLNTNAIKKNFLNSFDNETKSIVGSLLFGISPNEETGNLFRELHLIRLISNSGMVFNIIYVVLLFLLGHIFEKKISKLIILIGFTLFGIFSIPRFPIIKFIFIHWFLYINEHLLKKKFSYLQMLSITGIFFLIFDYHYAYQDTFLLCVLMPIVVNFINNSFKNIKGFKKKILTTLCISVFVMPFTISYYNEISPFSLLFQFIFSPLIGIYVLMSVVIFFKVPLQNGLNGFTLFLNNSLKFFKTIFIKIYLPSFNTLQIVLFYLILLMILYFGSIKFYKASKLLSIGLISVFSILCIPIKRAFYNSVSFINVGQGDACLVDYNGFTLMIDTGGIVGYDLAKSSLIPFLKKKQIYDLDLVITTHDDFDHNGAFSSLEKNFEVKNYISNYTDFPYVYNNFQIKNLNVYPDLWKEENDSSLVLQFTIYDMSFLIMGDAPKKIENKIVEDNPDLRCDVLKVGHHGSTTSTSDKFIKSVKPKIGIISVGKNNKYGHPDSTVLSILKNNKVEIKRTDTEGTITFTFSRIFNNFYKND